MPPYDTSQSSAAFVKQIIPNDTADLPFAARAILVGGGGTIKLTSVGGTTETVTVVPGVLPIQTRRVWAGGTTATALFALY